LATSRIPGPLGGPKPFSLFLDEPPGPLGAFGLHWYPDSPGPLGLNDWAAFVADPHATPQATGACACDRDITLDELCKCYPHAKRARNEEFLAGLNQTFKDSSINTCLRKAHFLAQVAAESGELHYVSEMLPKGVTEEKAYRGYKGRGLIQLTGKANYEAFGLAEKQDFLKENRVKVEEPEWAAKSAGWYWTSGKKNHDLNEVADKNDFLSICCLVNGAFIGYDERLAHLKLARDALGVVDCKKANVGKEVFKVFTDSDIYKSWTYSFAWGCWNDPTSKKKGIAKPVVTERKAGYQRYLDLRVPIDAAEALKPKPKHPPVVPKKAEVHYGYTIAQMTTLAKEGIK
jgi:putative chitinase